jgi:hypothetical protein
LGRGDDAKYLNLDEGGPKLGAENSEALLQKLYDQCQVVINPGAGNMTAEEVRHRFEAMYDKADLMRAQYGEAIVKLIELVARAVQRLASGGVLFDLPLPVPETVEVEWPDYSKPSSKDNESTMKQLAIAYQEGFVTLEAAVHKAAKILGIKDVTTLLEALINHDQNKEEASNG